MGVRAADAPRWYLVASLLATLASYGCSSGGGASPDAAGTAGASGTAGAGHGGAGAAGTAGGAAGAGGAAAGASGAAGQNGGAGATGTAGADGGATDGPTDGTATLTLLPPIVRGATHVLEFGKTKFVVDGTQGARIVELSLDGTNILTGPAVNAMYWGSTFWTAPESEWMPGLVPAFDTAAFAMSVGTDSSILAVGPNGTFAGKTLSVTKRFSADLSKPGGALAIEYSLTNKGTNTFTIGHWEVTRVPPDGLTFFPPGTGAPTVAGPIQVTSAAGHLWFDHKTFAKGPYGKYSADGSGGWVAHVVRDPAGGILLIKTFKDIPAGTAGAGHGEVEIYADPTRGYVEVEDHHEQVPIAAGVTVPWPVRWYLRRLPPGVAITVGNQALVDFVLTQIK